MCRLWGEFVTPDETVLVFFYVVVLNEKVES